VSAIVIEQTPEQVKLAFEVHQNADISRIRLARAKVASHSIDEAPKAQIQVKFTFKSRALDSPPGVLRLEIAYRMAGIETGAEAEADSRKKGRLKENAAGTKPETVILVDCAYEVDYALREGFEPMPEHVAAFKDGNAIFNSWPFFREYLQNNLLRMGLPALTAPFLRLQPRPRPRKPEKNEHQTEGSLPREGRQ
jgi:hypothetical protein